jgi:hypothetical protein
VTGPESNGVELLLKMTDFDNRLGLADVHHFAEEEEPGIERLARCLVDEREVNLVSEEGLLGGNGDVVLEDI